MDTKTIQVTLTDCWQLHELLRDVCEPRQLDAGNCLLLRKLQDNILALTFPDGVALEKLLAHRPSTIESAMRAALEISQEEAWQIVSHVSRLSYDGAQRVLQQVFFVLQQFSGYRPEPEIATDLPQWMRDMEGGDAHDPI